MNINNKINLPNIKIINAIFKNIELRNIKKINEY